MGADPSHYEFCDYVATALVLLSRRRLVELEHHGDTQGLAEALRAAPSSMTSASVLQVAHAICAFERRCGASSDVPFPLRRSGKDSVCREPLGGSIQLNLSSLWGKMTASQTDKRG